MLDHEKIHVKLSPEHSREAEVPSFHKYDSNDKLVGAGLQKMPSRTKYIEASPASQPRRYQDQPQQQDLSMSDTSVLKQNVFFEPSFIDLDLERDQPVQETEL